MSSENAKIILKWLTVILLSAALAVGIEMCFFNYHSFVKGERLDVSYICGEELPEEIEEAEILNRSVRIVFRSPVYMKKVKVEFNTDTMQEYTVNVRYQNMFQAEEIEAINDVYWPEIRGGYTSVEKNVLVIRLNVAPELIQSLHFYNYVEFNPYRAGFLFLLFGALVLFCGRGNYFSQKSGLVFAIICGCIGFFFVCTQSIQENGWDEEVHYKNVYQLASGTEMEVNKAYQIMTDRIPKEAYNTWEEKKRWLNYLNQAQKQKVSDVENGYGLAYNRLAYIFQAGAVKLTDRWGLSFTKVFFSGKVAGLCTYLLVMLLAIYLMPKRKELILAVALVPTQVFIAGTYSYDTITNSFLVLGFVLWLKVLLEKTTRYTNYYIIGSILAFGFGALAKAVYIPLLLLCCLFPKEKFRSKREYRIFWGVILGSCLLVALTFVLPTVLHTLSNSVGWKGDSRGGETDVVRQLKSLLKHPIQYAYMLIKSILETLGNYFTGHIGLANFGRIPILDDKYSFLTISWIMGMAFIQPEENTVCLKGRFKVGILTVVLLVLMLVWTALYLDYTPVGASEIAGVQARYYYPLLLPAIMVCSNQRVKWRIGRECYCRLVTAVPVILSLLSLYENVMSSLY